MTRVVALTMMKRGHASFRNDHEAGIEALQAKVGELMVECRLVGGDLEIERLLSARRRE